MLYRHLLLAFVSILAAVDSAWALNYNVSLNSQVHSSFHGSTGATISWNTYNQLSSPTVQYGLDPSNLDQLAIGNVSVTYNTSLTYNNHVVLSGLLPNTQYYYVPEDILSDAVPQPYTFITSRPLGDATPFVIAVVIDMGAMGSEGLTTTAGSNIPAQEILLPGEQNTIQSLTSEESTYEFVLHPGDLAYADTWLKETQSGFLDGIATYDEGYKAYESILDDFYDQLTPITTRKPYMVAPGNHEANCVNGASTLCMPGQENFTGYINHFRMPSDVATQAPNNYGVGNMWYSFDHGMAHFVVIDTETDFPDAPDDGYPAGPFGASGQQTAWLTADLAAVNRTVTPWVIVVGHRPWYSSGSICTACQTAFEGIINEYSVDLVMNGHFHVFERNLPIGLGGVADPNGLSNPSAPWYIVNGLGGHYGGLDNFTYPLASYQEYGISFFNATYGWSRLTFHNCTHLTHELVNSSSNGVLDTATLYKDRICPTTIINNYDIPGFDAPVQLAGAIQAPYGYIGYELFPEGSYNPSLCAQACNAVSAYDSAHPAADGSYESCDFFVAYIESINGVSEGLFCSFYTTAWNASYGTNTGQYRGNNTVTISNAWSYARST